MKEDIEALVIQLKQENRDRAIAMNDHICPPYTYTALTHKHNNTLEIIKRLEAILIANKF